MNVTFRDAGHILGSAQVVLDIHERGRKFRWLFSGDVGRGGDEILRDPPPVENVDYLQIESTYGGREHAVRTDADAPVGRLVLRNPCNQSGKVIIPAFSVGRTQQIVYVLHQLTLAGKLPRVPIFVDSPLSVNATRDLPPASRMFQRRTSPLPARKAKSLRHGQPHLHPRGRRIQEAERPQRTDGHHQRVGHVRSRAHPAPSEKQHRRREEPRPCSSAIAPKARWATRSRAARRPSTSSANRMTSAPKSSHSTPIPATQTKMN